MKTSAVFTECFFKYCQDRLEIDVDTFNQSIKKLFYCAHHEWLLSNPNLSHRDSDIEVEEEMLYNDLSMEELKEYEQAQLPKEKVMPEQTDIEKRFTYQSPKDDQFQRYVELREKAKELAVLVDTLCPSSREKSIAMTKIEEAVMWANVSIARNE